MRLFRKTGRFLKRPNPSYPNRISKQEQPTMQQQETDRENRRQMGIEVAVASSTLYGSVSRHFWDVQFDLPENHNDSKTCHRNRRRQLVAFADILK